MVIMICPAGGQPQAGYPQGVFGVFSYYRLVMLFLNMVCLILARFQSLFPRNGCLLVEKDRVPE
jgi:hypothetical protein